MVGNVSCKCHLVCNDQHGHAFVCQSTHNFQYFTYHFRVQCGCRLVKEQDLRLHRQSTGDRHTLFLSAGKLTRLRIDVRVHADFCQILHGLFFCFFFVSFQNFCLSDDAVLKNRHIVEQIKRLKYHAYFCTVCCRIDLFIHHAVSMKYHIPGGRCLQKVDAAKQCGFAGTGRTDDRCHIARMYNKINVFENGVGTKRFGQVFYFQNRISIHLSLPPFTSVSIFLSLSKLPSPG